MTYQEWADSYPQAASALLQVLAPAAEYNPASEGKSEAYAQQQARLSIARRGGLAWRNNVGASKSKESHRCPCCGFAFEVKQPPIRWGLCNDSHQLNAKIKSSDLIGIMPVLITTAMVGSTIGQFIAVETKRPGWSYKGDDHEVAQLAWLQLIASKGGVSMFSTGGDV